MLTRPIALASVLALAAAGAHGQSWLDQRTTVGPDWAQQRTSPVSSPRPVFVHPSPRPPICRPICPPTFPPICRPTPWDNGGFVSGSGLNVNGQFSSGNLDVAFHLGSGLNWCNTGTDVVCRPSWCVDSGCIRPCFPVNPGWNSGWYSSNWNWPRSTVSGIFAGVDPFMTLPTPAPAPATQPTTPPEPPEPIDLARQYIAQGFSAQAVPMLEKHLKDSPEDAFAMRLLALALIDDRRPQDGAAMMRMAYQTDPGMGAHSISAAALNLDAARLRTLVSRAVTLAHRQQSGSSWLTVAVLMQAQGKFENAARMLRRATDAGMTTEITDPLAGALRRG